MSNFTPNLNLFKYDPTVDGNRTFNIDYALNGNFDILDEEFSKLGSNFKGVINNGNLDSNGHLDLFDAGSSSDTTYEYSEAGDYTITLAANGDYEVSLIGGGGYGSGSFAYPNPACTAGGGSGAGFIGTITLAAGTYTITVGGNTRNGNRDTVLKDSNNNVIIKAGGGGNGFASSYSISATGGAWGVLTNNATVVGTATLETSGNQGGSNTYGGGAAPGKSVYDDTFTGYGAGGKTSVYNGGATGYAGVSGYFKLKINSVPSEDINYKVSQSNPLVITDFKGKQSTFYSLNTDLADSLSDGTYNKFLDENGSELIANTIYAQLKEPASPSTNDVWIRTTDKVQAFKYDGEEWQEYNKVWLGSVDISSGAASNAVNAELCNNNFNVTTYQLTNYRKLVKLYQSSDTWYKIYKEYNPVTGAYVGLWAECGDSYYKGSNAQGDYNISFPFTTAGYRFINTNYTFIPQVLHSDANLGNYGCYEKYSVRDKAYTTLRVVGQYFGYAWTASGYIETI